MRAKCPALWSKSPFLILGLLLSGSLLAQPVQLPDAPLAAKNNVPATVMLIADDSASMKAAFTPDNLGTGTGTPTNFLVTNACYACTGTPMAVCWMTCDTTNANTGALFTAAQSIFKDGQPPLSAAAFNGLAYNPLVTYTPPIQPDGTPFPAMDGSSAANGGAGWTNVVWTTPLWTTIDRPPAANLRTLTYAYTTAQYNALKNQYMIGAVLPSVTTSPITVGNSGSSATYTFPVHYFRTSIKWCQTLRTSGPLIGSANPGTISVTENKLSFSNCKDEYMNYTNLTGTAFKYIYPYYYSPSADYNLDVNAANNLNKPAFDLVVLDPVNVRVATVSAENNWTFTTSSTVDHWYFDGVEGTKNKITRTAQEEITNYANWAAYYRNRVAAVKSVASLAFAGVPGNRISAGFVTINTTTSKMPAALGRLEEFGSPTSAPNRTAFYQNLISFQASGSSSINGVVVGTPLRKALDDVGKKFGSTYINASSTSSCQKNHVIMFTDGRWNDSNYSTNTGNLDTTVQLPLPTTASSIDIYGSSMNPATRGVAWPAPIYDMRSVSETLADIALKYWSNRLGPASLGNNVSVTGKDPATWPHLNFHGMGFGVRGILPSSDQSATLAQIASRALAWPMPTDDTMETVDDFWHATINGFGRYVTAASPDDFRRGLNAILNEVLNVGGARTASAFTSRDMTGGNVGNYAVSFLPGWSGDVVLKKVLPTGEIDASSSLVSAADKLQTLLTPSGTSAPWRDSRYVFTRIAGEHSPTTNAVPFQFTELTSTQLSYLGGTNATTQKNMVAYLRGDRTNEGTAAGKFRVRGKGPLGDIVDAAPVVVKNPGGNYDDTTNGGYRTFAEDNKSRSTMVYVAANDGMLHAFDADLNERWAYIPMDILRNPATGGIAALSYQEDDFNHPFYHFFYINATPRTMDVKIGDTWKTVLVGGLGKGGKSYYALDITDSAVVTDEAAAAPMKSLWEFTDPNMGYTFGRPILTKTNAWPNPDAPDETKWVAILPSGYNNADGKACLFFVDLESGLKLTELCTTEGTGSDPLGMVSIGGYVEDAHNQLTTYVYGGDQKGNLWRFNLNSASASDWVVEKMALLRDDDGNPQYVTTEPWPQLNRDGTKRYVLVGTGGFRNDGDLIASTPLNNTFYSIYDNGAATNLTRDDLQPIIDLDGVTGENGWYEDMDSGYHINLNPQSAYFVAAWAANKYNGNASGGSCTTASIDGKFYARTVDFGQPALGETFAGAGDGTSRFYSVPSGISGFTFALVNGDNGNGGSTQRLTAIIDDTFGKKIPLPGNLGFGRIPVGASGASTFKRLNVRFIDH